MNATEFAIIKVAKDHVDALPRNVVTSSMWLRSWEALRDSEMAFNADPEAFHRAFNWSYVRGWAERAH